MTQIFFPSSLNSEYHKVYCYINNFTNIVIAKIHGIKNRHCERVIFPKEKFLFIADDNCQLEIIRQTDIGIIKDTVDCSQLKAIEK